MRFKIEARNTHLDSNIYVYIYIYVTMVDCPQLSRENVGFRV